MWVKRAVKVIGLRRFSNFSTKRNEVRPSRNKLLANCDCWPLWQPLCRWSKRWRGKLKALIGEILCGWFWMMGKNESLKRTIFLLRLTRRVRGKIDGKLNLKKLILAFQDVSSSYNYHIGSQKPKVMVNFDLCFQVWDCMFRKAL